MVVRDQTICRKLPKGALPVLTPLFPKRPSRFWQKKPRKQKIQAGIRRQPRNACPEPFPPRVHRFYQTPARASVWIDAHALTHSLRSRASARALLFVHQFYQTPARAAVWIDALSSWKMALRLLYGRSCSLKTGSHFSAKRSKSFIGPRFLAKRSRAATPRASEDASGRQTS